MIADFEIVDSSYVIVSCLVCLFHDAFETPSTDDAALTIRFLHDPQLPETGIVVLTSPAMASATTDSNMAVIMDIFIVLFPLLRFVVVGLRAVQWLETGTASGCQSTSINRNNCPVVLPNTAHCHDIDGRSGSCLCTDTLLYCGLSA
jgi:hypothetical protein